MTAWLFLVVAAHARLIRHPKTAIESEVTVGPQSSDYTAEKTCDVPVAKAKVVFPEHITGRASDYNMYSGYVNVTEEDWLFYWFFEAKTSAGNSSTPTILWSNGGPGCSAMEGKYQMLCSKRIFCYEIGRHSGATTENGPLVLDMIKQSSSLQSGQFR